MLILDLVSYIEVAIMEVSKEDNSLVLLDRASRATRGKRLEFQTFLCDFLFRKVHEKHDFFRKKSLIFRFWCFFFYARMTKLIDDELEEDELFWNQEALKDVSKIHIFKKKKKKKE